jgi:hypothetical protein
MIITSPLQMAKHAWGGYAKYAWGKNELKPMSKQGHTASVFGKNTEVGATIVDSLDTLYLMGLRDEFEEAKKWVKVSLDLSKVRKAFSQTTGMWYTCGNILVQGLAESLQQHIVLFITVVIFQKQGEVVGME